jgi:formate-dependent nitrite reductase membrane component NrfD
MMRYFLPKRKTVPGVAMPAGVGEAIYEGILLAANNPVVKLPTLPILAKNP